MISVCIATHNGERYLRQQLDSIMPQLSGEDEIVISDDQSTDSTRTLVASYDSPRIRLIDGPCLGVTKNFENALKHARGDYIFLADQDDVWTPDKVEVSLRYLAQYDCIVSDCFVTDGDLRVVHESFQTLLGGRTGMAYNLLIRNCYIGCCMAFSRRVLEACIPFPANIPLHDIWIGNVAAALFNVHFMQERLVFFRRHNASASSSAHPSTYGLWRRLQFRRVVAVALAKLLLRRKFKEL